MRLRLGLPLFAAVMAFGQESPRAVWTADDVAAGARIFRSHCAPCHGPNGKGGLGPNLTSNVFFHGARNADIYRNITEGIPGTAMPGTFFDGTQAWQIVAYIRSIGQTAGTAPVAGEISKGAALFREKGCSGCHLVHGEGGVKGPDLSTIGSQRSPDYLRHSMLEPDAQVAPEYRVAKISLRDGKTCSGFIMNEDTHMLQILDFSSGLRSLPRTDVTKIDIDRRSIMPSYKGKLSDAELDDLVSYLWSLKRESRGE